jgi:hypothetical protein
MCWVEKVAATSSVNLPSTHVDLESKESKEILHLIHNR